MILYVNGDSNSAGSETLTDFNSCGEDPRYETFRNKAHPENVQGSYAYFLSQKLNAELLLAAQSGRSNDAIIRTTHDFINNISVTDELVILIGWTSWSREEWFIDGKYYQINARNTGELPIEYHDRYNDWLSSLDLNRKEQEAHEKIKELHLYLEHYRIKHFFFNSLGHFDDSICKRIYWGKTYLDPYKIDFYHWALEHGFAQGPHKHFRTEAHQAWADLLISHLTKIL